MGMRLHSIGIREVPVNHHWVDFTQNPTGPSPRREQPFDGVARRPTTRRAIKWRLMGPDATWAGGDGSGMRVENATISVEGALAARIWSRDPTAWGPGDDDPRDRLGWLDLPISMAAEVGSLREFAATSGPGIESLALLGMGGSSLAPEVFAATSGSRGGARLEVCDSTHPEIVRAQTEALDLDRTLVVVSSKSGTTVETLSLYRRFRALQDDGHHYVAVTDPKTSLEALAADAGFLKTFLNPPDIGGRFSALSLFGLVPAALLGADLDGLLASARSMAELCRGDTESNPGLALGSAIAAQARAGRDKLTLVISAAWLPFGDWIEQLVAESTGKQGVGITPVVREPLVAADVYGDDRVFVHIRVDGDDTHGSFAGELAAAGHPILTFDVDAGALGAELFRWEFATAVAGSLMGINAFDQPDVEAAKEAARAALDSADEASWPEEDPDALLEGATPGELACLLAFAPHTDGTAATLEAGRRKIVESYGIATSAGFGPRYLHSTGQLHKGGPPTVRALVILDPPAEDVAIPGSPYGFARLVSAQAAGDARALEAANRRVARTTWTRFEEWALS
jgi:transaldolase/glucose-6-phosphate isomerase